MRKQSLGRTITLRYLAIVFLLVLLTILTVGCKSADKVRNLIGNDPQTVSCWRGICPGQSTSPDEVMSMLGNMAGVSKQEYDPVHNQVHFQWNDLRCVKDNNCSISGSVIFSSTNIGSIILKLDYEITIGELIAYFGSPGCILVMKAYPDWFSVLFKYPGRGIGFEIQPLANNTDHVVKSNMLVDSIILVDTDAFMNCAENDYYNAYKWRGFDAVYP
jgi:hypothetical protein